MIEEGMMRSRRGEERRGEERCRREMGKGDVPILHPVSYNIACRRLLFLLIMSLSPKYSNKSISG